jgi:Mrp family chromosome partitioning ATPase
MTDPKDQRRRRERLDLSAKAELEAEIARIAADSAARRPATPKPAPQRVTGTPPDTASDSLPDLRAAFLDIWNDIPHFTVDPAGLEANLVITATREDPAHVTFDVLRTRLIGALNENGWSRVGITSPRAGCGKTFTAANLAVTLSRYDSLRVVLLDMDLRRPSLNRLFGVTDSPSTADFLRGTVAPVDYLRRPGPNVLNIGDTLAIGFNNRVEPYASELFHGPATAAAINRLQQETRADIMLFDLPPALALDDIISLRPNFDGLLLVAGGGKTTAREMRETVRRVGEDKPIIGVVLNQAQGEDTEDYAY